MSATKAITRSTTVVQRLEINVNMGPLPKAAHLTKVRVTRKADGVDMYVNERDYDEDPKSKKPYTGLHYRVVEGFDPDLGKSEPVASEINSLYTADDLATMMIADLKKCPEWSRISIQDRNKLNSKQEHVDAIIAQRKPRAAGKRAREAITKD
jgi:hypothetical protein